MKDKLNELRRMLEELSADGVCAAFSAPHLPQEAQPAQAPQEAQLPPQALFPAFLSRIIPRISSVTTSAMTATRAILIQLAVSQRNIRSHPFEREAARESGGTPRAASGREEEWITERSASALPCKA